MSYDNFLLHRYTNQRQNTVAVDSHNLPVDNQATVSTAQLCRLIQEDEQVYSDELSKAVVITRYKLLVLPSADVLAKDLFAVTLEDGSVLNFLATGSKPSRMMNIALKYVTLERLV